MRSRRQEIALKAAGLAAVAVVAAGAQVLPAVCARCIEGSSDSIRQLGGSIAESLHLPPAVFGLDDRPEGSAVEADAGAEVETVTLAEADVAGRVEPVGDATPTALRLTVSENPVEVETAPLPAVWPTDAACPLAPPAPRGKVMRTVTVRTGEPHWHGWIADADVPSLFGVIPLEVCDLSVMGEPLEMEIPAETRFLLTIDADVLKINAGMLAYD